MWKKGGVYSREAFSRGRAFIRSNTVSENVCLRKHTNKTLIQKCEIIREFENSMTNKDALEKFGILKNTISTKQE